MDEEIKLLISYDLQFFAKDGEGGEKTEQPTAKKLKDARSEGKVAKSKELTAGISLLAFFFTMRVFSGFLGSNFREVFLWILQSIPDIVRMNGGGLTVPSIANIMQNVIVKMLFITMPFLLIGFVVAYITNYIQVGWILTTKPLKPNFGKFNPINGFKRIFSKESLFNLLMAIVKITLIFYVAYNNIKKQANSLFVLYDMGLNQALSLIFGIIIDTGIRISILYIVLGFVDFIYQKWKYKDDMKMTKQEVKDEFKNAEGDPAVKGKQRARMREASQRRMMNNVPQADVVITNPTHIAVAIKYDNEMDEAPRVLAKGEDYLANKIKEKAKEAEVPIVENKPLARALYATVEIGETIPPEMYQAVAEILAVVYTNKAG